MILLPNVFFDVLRSSYSTVSGTDVVEPYLKHIEGHITRIKDSPKVPSNAATLRAEYELYTDTIYDIERGDQIINIIRINTNKFWFVEGDNEFWTVMDSVNSSPGFLEYKDIIIGQYVAGGPV